VSRREYDITIFVNGQMISKVIIDPHYELKHSESINDEIILALVKALNGTEAEPETTDESFSYFVNDGIEYQGKTYKLVWLMEDHQIYIGVVNAYRR
jgi:hypothetical protein